MSSSSESTMMTDAVLTLHCHVDASQWQWLALIIQSQNEYLMERFCLLFDSPLTSPKDAAYNHVGAFSKRALHMVGMSCVKSKLWKQSRNVFSMHARPQCLLQSICLRVLYEFHYMSVCEAGGCNPLFLIGWIRSRMFPLSGHTASISHPHHCGSQEFTKPVPCIYKGCTEPCDPWRHVPQIVHMCRYSNVSTRIWSSL